MPTVSIRNHVLGPAMRGPSGSHAAVAYRMGKMAAKNPILGGCTNPISLDDAVDASCAVGKQLSVELRCAALGGVAATPSAKAFIKNCSRCQKDAMDRPQQER